MVLSPVQPITLEQFLQQPETEPASEYLDGEILQKPMPKGKHSILQSRLLKAINQLAEDSKIALALPELRCTFANRSIVPDVAVFAWDRIPVDASGEIANSVTICPDWVIEILSPEQNLIRVTHKVLHCLNHGCQVGWIIDPEERTLLVYPAQQQPNGFDQPDQPIPAPLLVPDLTLTVSQLFSWMQVQK
jgi:Uma2 family endonuclease